MITFTTTFSCDSCPKEIVVETAQKGIKQQEDSLLTPFRPTGWQLPCRRPRLLCDVCIKKWRVAVKETDNLYLGKNIEGENGQ